MNKVGRSSSGFTLVELTLSMTFIGSLLIIIALTTMQIMSIYNKGLTLKEVNNVSRMVVRDMQQSISGVNAFIVNYNDTNGNVVSAESLEEATSKNQHYYQNEKGGRLCTGSYSYAWNFAKTITGVGQGSFDSAGVQYIQDGSKKVPIRFVRVFDTSHALCEVSSDNQGTQLPDLGHDYLNVFGEGNNNLSLYTFEIATPLGSPISIERDETGSDNVVKNNVMTMSTFYKIKFTLGTQMGDENISGVDDSKCKSPAESDLNNSEYCAINVIEFVARTNHL